jgi:hypothetical protein
MRATCPALVERWEIIQLYIYKHTWMRQESFGRDSGRGIREEGYKLEKNY